MKASELEVQLNHVANEYGDCDVVIDHDRQVHDLKDIHSIRYDNELKAVILTPKTWKDEE